MKPDKLNKRLKFILTKRTSLSEEAADSALAIAEKEKKPFSQVLISQNLLSEKEYIGAVSREMKLPPIDVSKVSLDHRLTEIIPENVAKYYKILPLSKMNNLLTVAVADPFDIVKLDDLRIVTKCELRPVISTEDAIQEAIKKNYDKSDEAMSQFIDEMADPGIEMEMSDASGDDEEIDISTLKGEGDAEHPIIRLVNMIIYQGIREKASDIHIEPFDKRIRVRYRVDGKLRETTSPPRKMHSAISSRLKILAGMDIAERRKPQDGKFKLHLEGRQIDFRISALPTVYGEKIVMRILDSSNLALSLDSLGFEPQTLKQIRSSIASPYGMILVTGPTGSGKSTTLYSCLKEVYSEEDNVITVEEPVEYHLDGINQVPVNPKQGLTFAAALRSILRQDPDKIMIGEIRDVETVEIAVKAALTGHLVLSTLHTNDAPSTITRLVDMGVDSFLVASSVILVLAQRLGRKLCKECKQPDEHTEEQLREVGFTEEMLKSEMHLYKAVGCPLCENKGYKGRFAIVESLLVSEKIRRAIIGGESAIEIKKIALEEGMISLRMCGLLNAMRGITSIEEVLKVTLVD